MQKIDSYADWAERFRPRFIRDVEGQDDIKRRFQKFVDNRNFPRLILVGDPGVGKTTLVKCLAREIFGRTLDILVLNASDSSRLEDARNEIIPYMQQKSMIAPFKILILEEAEPMTPKTQMALRSAFETYSANCKVAITCNTIAYFTDAILSRFKVFRLHKLKALQIANRLSFICKKVDVEYTPRQLMKIAIDSRGDMRKAISDLQSVAEGVDSIEDADIASLRENYACKNVGKIITYALQGKFEKALFAFEKSSRFVTGKTLYGFLEEELASSDSEFSELEKARIALALSYMPTNAQYVDKNQMYGFLARLYFGDKHGRKRVQG